MWQLDIGIHYSGFSCLSQARGLGEWVIRLPPHVCPNISLCLCLNCLKKNQNLEIGILGKFQSRLLVLDVRICFVTETRIVDLPLTSRSPTWNSYAHDCPVTTPAPPSPWQQGTQEASPQSLFLICSLPNSHFLLQSPLLPPVDFTALDNIYQLDSHVASSLNTTRDRQLTTQQTQTILKPH